MAAATNLGVEFMRRITFFALLATLAIAVPAAGYHTPKPPKPPKQHKPKPPKQHKPKPPKPHKPKPPKHKPKPPKPCVAHNVGYNASGTLVKAGTKLRLHKHRFRGTLEVVLKKASPHSALGDHKFKLVRVQVKLRHGLSAKSLADGDRVAIHGKISALPARCSTAGFTPKIVVKKVAIEPPAKHKKKH